MPTLREMLRSNAGDSSFVRKDFKGRAVISLVNIPILALDITLSPISLRYQDGESHKGDSPQHPRSRTKYPSSVQPIISDKGEGKNSREPQRRAHQVTYHLHGHCHIKGDYNNQQRYKGSGRSVEHESILYDGWHLPHPRLVKQLRHKRPPKCGNESGQPTIHDEHHSTPRTYRRDQTCSHSKRASSPRSRLQPLRRPALRTSQDEQSPAIDIAPLRDWKQHRNRARCPKIEAACRFAPPPQARSLNSSRRILYRPRASSNAALKGKARTYIERPSCGEPHCTHSPARTKPKAPKAVRIHPEATFRYRNTPITLYYSTGPPVGMPERSHSTVEDLRPVQHQDPTFTYNDAVRRQYQATVETVSDSGSEDRVRLNIRDTASQIDAEASLPPHSP